MIKCSLSMYLTPLFLVLASTLLSPMKQAEAEIYTYEQDGVIIISSEPPPRPRRKRNRGRKKARTQNSPERSLSIKKHKRNFVKKTTKSKMKRFRKQFKGKSLPVPRTLRRLKNELQQLNIKYKFPKYLLSSVFKTCHFLSHSNDRSRMAYQSMTCLSKEVSEEIAVKVQHPILKSRFNDLEYASWLLRKLINNYRGDLTLALSAYFMSAQNKRDFRSVVSKRNTNKSQLMTLKSLVTASSQPLNQRTSKSQQQSKRSAAFLKYVLGELKREE